jgi:tetratricopeptide (TPR) repeat protein
MAKEHYPEAVKLLETAERLAHSTHDERLLVAALSDFVVIFLNTGQHDKATHCAEDGLQVARRVNEPLTLANALQRLAFLTEHSDRARTLACYGEALQIAERIDARLLMTVLCEALGHLFRSEIGNVALARQYFQRALALAYSLGQEKLERELTAEVAACRATIREPSVPRLYDLLTDAIRREPLCERVLTDIAREEGLPDTHSLDLQQLCDHFEEKGNSDTHEGRTRGPQADRAATVHSALVRVRNHGEEYRRQQEHTLALACYGCGAILAQALDDEHMLGILLNESGRVYSARGENRKALHYFQLSALIVRAIGDTPELATRLFNLGSILDDLGDQLQADRYYAEAESAASMLGDLTRRARTFQRVGDQYAMRRDYDRALQSYRACERLFRQLGDLPQLEAMLDVIGVTLRRVGRPRESLPYRLEAAQLLEAQGKQQDAMPLYFMVATMLEIDLHEPAEAISWYEKVARDGTDAGDSSYATEAHARIARCQRMVEQGRTSPSPGFDAVWQVAGPRAAVARAVQMLAEREQIDGPQDDAEHLFARLAQKLGTNAALAYAFELVGSIHVEQRAYERALACYCESERCARLGHLPVLLATTLSTQGDILVGLDRSTEALPLYSEAVELAATTHETNLEDSISFKLGTLLPTRTEYAAALRHFKRCETIARESGNRRYLAIAMQHLGLVLSDQRLSHEAVVALSEAETLARAIGDHRLLGNILFNKGDAYVMAHSFDSALACYRESNELMQGRDAQEIAQQVEERIASVMRLLHQTGSREADSTT